MNAINLKGTGGLHEALTGETPTELTGIAAVLPSVVGASAQAGPINFPFLGLDYAFLQVREFHEAFQHPIADRPTLMDRARMEARAKWMREEIDEFLDPEKHTIVDGADAMIDLIYFALGTLVEMGVLPQPMMDIVHYEGNMSKMHTVDGEKVVVKNELGKVIKPADWVAPEPKLEQEVERQSVQLPLCDVGA